MAIQNCGPTVLRFVCLALLCLATRASAATYFINDGSTNGDCYVTAVGSDTNSGTNAASPKASFTNLFATYTLVQGDTVYIDTGSYSNYPVVLTASGVATNKITLQGSTNYAAGGTVFNRGASDYVMLISANHYRIRDLTLRGGLYGLYVNGSENEIYRIIVRGMTYGVYGGGGVNNRFQNCVAFQNTYGFRWGASGWVWDHGVSWGNSTAFLFDGTGLTISNSVIVGGTAFSVGVPKGDHNVLWDTTININGYSTLNELQAGEASWQRSTYADPQFANPTNLDFHEKSTVGRFLADGTEVTDTVHSILIDFANRGAAYSNELSPNGARANAGCFGNTPQAGKSRTNAWVLALSYNDGGALTATGQLAWTAGNMVPTATVTLAYSTNLGSSWITITNGVRATNELFNWVVTGLPPAVICWKLAGEGPYTAAVDSIDGRVSLNGALVPYYVNDASTNGDAYCTAAGNETNNGTARSSPMGSLTNLLAQHKLAPNSIVYVDTGSYSNYQVYVGPADQGSRNGRVIIQGSTNVPAGGTIIRKAGGGEAMFVSGSYVTLNDLTVRDAQYGVYLDGSHCQFNRVTCRNNVPYGFYGGGGISNVFRHCVSAGNTVGFRWGNTGWRWDHGVLYNNTTAFQFDGTFMTVSNTVISGGTAFSSGIPRGDNNVIWNASIGLGYPTLFEMQEAITGWWYSVYANPEFVDPASYDFHEKSVAGRFSPSLNAFITGDTTNSILLDFGTPASTDYTNEVAPNGSRINGGLFGGTGQASKSRTNAWLMALTFNDGGTLSAPGDVIYWNYGNLATNAKVRIELSADGGNTWSIVETNILASSGSYAWASTNFSSSLFGRWRVVSESNTNVYDAIDTNIVYRSGNFDYFINDASLTGDVYCTAPGSDTNLGTSAGSPKLTLAALLLDHDIEPGDRVFIDTGNYVLGANQVITVLDSGTATSRVAYIGSTNKAAGGTVFNRADTNSAAYALHLNGASYVDILDVTVRNAGDGIRVENAQDVTLSRMFARDCIQGIRVRNSLDVRIANSASANNAFYGLYMDGTASARLDFGAIWMNGVAGVFSDQGSVTISNSIVAASGTRAYAYWLPTPTNVIGDYNAVHTRFDAVVGYIGSLVRNVDSLGAWTALTGQEVHSLETDPLIADESVLDFHLKTETPFGRFLPGYGHFLADSQTSPLIDAGHPGAAYTNETAPNGGRVDIGLYGNTAEASFGRTNATLFAASLRDGGWTRGTSTLHWVAYAVTSTAMGRVDMSTDGGENWVVLTNAIRLTNESVRWNTLATGATPAALWRVVDLADTNVGDQVTNFFGLRNSNLTFYVNNLSLDGDMYATGLGRTTNWVATADRPQGGIETVFNLYDVEGGDRILVDSGIYTNNTIYIGRRDGGMTGFPVVILASTNEANRTFLQRQTTPSNSYGMVVDSTAWIEVSNLAMRASTIGVLVTNSTRLGMGLRSVSNTSHGFVLRNSSWLTFPRAVAAFNGGDGMVFDRLSFASVAQSIVWSNGGSALVFTSSTVAVSNSVLGVWGNNNYAFNLSGAGDVTPSDYNDIFVGGGAQVGRSGTTPYKQLYRWQEARSNDLHSLSHDPLFNNPAGYDFHARSEAGRFSTTGGIVIDAATSPIIDTADPLAPFTNEPAPNGSRRNMGLYGDTSRASQSRTNGWLLALTLNSGGSFRGTNALYWVAGGSVTGELVSIDYSHDGGATWTNIASNVAASAGSIVWTSTPYLGSTLGKWQVRSESSTGIVDDTDSFFSLNNSGLEYYVNDESTSGDIFCTAAGSSTNDGLSAASPRSSIRSILNDYDLREGDQIIVDTGVYTITNAVRIDANTAGHPTNRVVIRGSTNYAAGGTVLRHVGNEATFEIRQTTSIGIEHFIVTGAVAGVAVVESTNCRIESVRLMRPDVGFEVSASDSNLFLNCSAVFFTGTGLVHRGGSDNVWLDGALTTVNSSGTCVRITNGTLVVSNSVLVADGPYSVAYALGTVGQLVADYNNVLVTNGAYAGVQEGERWLPIYDTLSRWSRDTGRDRHSLSHDPGFYDAAAGDLHALSLTGRFEAATTSFVADAESSVLIDAGHPGASYTNETAPNGGRRNIGPYADTPEASRTASNRFVTLVSLNDGGRAEGTNVTLYWVARGWVTSSLFRLEYSHDNGVSWTLIASNVAASAGSYAWNSTGYVASMQGFWRVRNQADNQEEDRTDRPFALRNQQISFYINDAETSGDVYSTVGGNVTNNGLSADQPMLSLSALLDAYDIEGGDRIYIDTGVFTGSQNIVLGQLDSGLATNPVYIIGSTNEGAAGSVFSGIGFDINEFIGLEMQNLVIQPDSFSPRDRAVDGFISSNLVFRNVHVAGGNDGVVVERCGEITFFQSIVRNARTNGIQTRFSGRVTIDSCVVWSNNYGIRTDSGGSLALSNSIIGAFGSNQVAMEIRNTLASDYNNYWLSAGADLAVESAQPIDAVYESLTKWTQRTGRDRHSLTHDPMFNDAGAGSMYLKSQGGRYDPFTQSFTTDGTTSPLIDAGDPSAPTGAEPAPNGARRNMGNHGTTMFASKTPTNGSVTVVSLNDGGIANGTNTLLYWVARGDAANDLVSVQASVDGGQTWQVIASNIVASTAQYIWDATAVTSSLQALWRVVSQDDTNVWDVSDALFAIRNQPFNFYVNDASTNGDVYTTVPGSSTNSGLTPSSPMASVSEVLNLYDVEGGDTIYIDTGLYASPNSIIIGQTDSAELTNAPRVVLQGSTNYAAGGTVLDRQGGQYGIYALLAVGLDLRNLTIRNAQTAVNLLRSYGTRMHRVDIVGGNRGIDIFSADNLIFDRCSVRGASSEGINFVAANNVKWEHSVLWSNGLYAIKAQGGSIHVSNSVIGVYGSNTYAYAIESGSIMADYNNIFLTNGANAAYRNAQPLPLVYQTVSRWRRDNTQDVHSLTHDPRFVSVTAGDYHIRSAQGHYDIATATFVPDSVTSPLVDAGSLETSYTNEPDPNGLRLNIGLFGGGAEASLSPTNASLTAVTLNDGGHAEGTNWMLYWVARGDATGHAVRLDYSADAGQSWQTIATNLSPTNATFSWNSALSTSSMRGVWRVVSLVDTNVYDDTDKLFALHNTNIYFYVNDGSTSGDVYSTAIGSSTNTGLSPDQPLDDVRRVLERWDLEPGDVVYVDTGTYTIDSPIYVDRFDAGIRTNDPAYAVTIRGSTNEAAGGSIINANGLVGVYLFYAPGVHLEHLTIRNASRGLRVERSDHMSAQYIRTEKGVDGYEVIDSVPVEFINCLAWANADRGLYVRGPFSRVDWANGVLWSNQFGVYLEEGQLDVANTVLGAFGVGSYAYLYLRGTLNSDYNNIVLQQDALCGITYPAGVVGSQSNRYDSVSVWSKSFGRDIFSLTFNPEFADDIGGDFHLKSSNGRFVPGQGWTNDTSTSLLIDSGDPDSDYSQEPSLNGGRVNIDLYGNTWQATKTPTNGWLSIISYNDGGSIQGTNVELRFFAGWIATGHLVTVDYSPDAGMTWTNIVSNRPAANPFYIWNSEPYGRSAVSMWRVTSENDTNLFDISDEFFVLRNGGTIEYYVNDTSTVGDVYTTAPGATNNSGLLPSIPMASVQAVLDRYKLEPVDVIFVDTGVYYLTNSIQVDDLDSGSSNSPVIILGSTNFNDGGTVLDRQVNLGSAITLANAIGIQARNLTVRGADVGVTIAGSRNCELERITAQANRRGFDISSSTDIDLLHCVSRLNSSNGLTVAGGTVAWRSGVIWDNPSAVIVRNSGQLTLQNSALRVSGYGRRVFNLDLGSHIVDTDYNNILAVNGALIMEQIQPIGGNTLYTYMYDWQTAVSQDVHSLSHDPFFVDEVSGDFHLRSTVGRVVAGGGFTNDAQHSPMIDTGDPSSVYTNEMEPNGARIDVGVYGNTPDASLSQTNPWVLALTLNDGGTIGGTASLYWAYGSGIPATNLVRLEYSLDGGIEYDVIATNLAIGTGTYAWDCSALPLTTLAKWRIMLQSDSNVVDEVDNVFSIKNFILTVYVNDTSTVCDAYCTAVGSETNNGLSPSSPLADPSDALARFPLGAGDTVYIDTGYYQPTNTMLLTDRNRGALGLPLVIRGSTNVSCGGYTVLDFEPIGIEGLSINGTRYIEVSDVRIKSGQYGLVVNNALECRFSNVETYSNTVSGILVSQGQGLSFDRCASWANRSWGVQVVGGSTIVTWNRGVVWSNRMGAFSQNSAALYVSNSIVHAPFSTGVLFSVFQGTVRGDYNVFSRETNNTRIAFDVFANESLVNLKEWQNRGTDAHSVLVDPMMAEPAAGDFHLKSQAGRYLAGSFVTDTGTSWAIDAASPSSSYVLEPSPNGARMNAGLHGDSLQASKSYAGSPQLLAVSLEDGGTVSGSQLLYWLSQGMSPTSKVRIEFSSNSGQTWSVIAEHVNVTDQGYLWSNTNPPTPVAKWRVVDEANTNVSDTTTSSFILRVGPIYYYINDASTNGDVFTTAPGSPFNSGLTSNTPLNSIQTALDLYDMESGDIVFVDTGTYNIQTNLFIGSQDGGESTQRVSIVGSPNKLAGGSVLQLATTNISSGLMLIRMYLVEGIALDSLTMRNADIGILFEQAQGNLVQSCHLSSNASAAIYMQQSSGLLLGRSVITRNGGDAIVAVSSGGLTVSNSVLWANAGNGIVMDSTDGQISNSVISAVNAETYCYVLTTNAIISSDYNNLFVTNGGNYALLNGIEMEGLPQWTFATTQDVHTLSVYPEFADPAGDDYHLRSPMGRFDPASSLFITTDTVYSLLIDTANPGLSFANEPAPNGGRRNLGLHADTAEESKSRTNAWLLCISASAGGRLEGTNTLVWAYGGMDSNELVSLDYSYDLGLSWSNVTTQTVGSMEHVWPSSAKFGTQEVWVSSPIALWKITSLADTNVYDVTDSHFALRNHPFFYYVNDGSTNCDIWTTAPGSCGSLGLFSYDPACSLHVLLSRLDVEGGDVILVDSGNYGVTATNAPIVGPGDAGKASARVEIRFSTNYACGGGAILSNAAAGAIALLQIQGGHVNIHDMRTVGGDVNLAGTGLLLTNAVITNGSLFAQGSDILIRDSSIRRGDLELAGTNSAIGRVQVLEGNVTMTGAGLVMSNTVVYSTNGVAVTVSGGAGLALRHNTIVSHATAFRQEGSASSGQLLNNILVASGASGGDAFCIRWDDGLLSSDYNNLVARNGAWIGNRNGFWERLMYWQRESGLDARSLAHDPLFADEAGYDFHLKSQGGRFQGGLFTNDAVHSPSIDTGQPGSPLGNETLPNGGRANMGAYGNTAEASRSRTNAYLLVTSPNDGGVVKGTNVTLRWFAGGSTTSTTVSIQFSGDGGSSWTTIATGVSLTSGVYNWNTTNVASSLNALWRVVLGDDTNVLDQSDNAFSVRNIPLNFYVNDALRTGDVFSLTNGFAAGDGLSPTSPALSIQSVLNLYDMEGGDVLFVDTGTYSLTSNVRVIWSDGGISSTPFTVRGSTNVAAGGTVLDRNDRAGGKAFDIKASYIRLKDLRIRNAFEGVLMDSNRFSTVERMLLYSNEYGVINRGTAAVTNQNLVLWNNLTLGIDVANARTTRVENSTFVGQGYVGARFAGAVSNVVQNNIFYMTVTNSRAMVDDDTNTLKFAFIDYNIYYMAPEASNATIDGLYTTIQQRQRALEKDYRSNVTNPLFANVTGGDFHVRSTAGRFLDSINNFTNDTVNSWAIDAGNPFSSYTNEPVTNGSRVNVGAYGNTEYASKGSTNIGVSARVLDVATTLSTNDNPMALVWSARNTPTGATVTVQYSGDNGLTWIDLATNVPAEQEYIVWSLTPTYNSYGKGLWRVVGEGANPYNLGDTNNGAIYMFFGEFAIDEQQKFGTQAFNRITWRGAWGESYQVQYAETRGATNRYFFWTNAVDGAGALQDASFMSTLGGDFTYEDPESTGSAFRIYRVILNQYE
jgi:hypothetical protein